MQWIWYEKSEPFSILFKETLSEEMPFSKLNNIPGSQKGRPVNIRNISLEKLYGGPRPVTKEKKKDMEDLLWFFAPLQHHYYKSLVSNEDPIDVDPLLNTDGNSDDEWTVV